MEIVNPKASAMPVIEKARFGWDGLEDSVVGYDLSSIIMGWQGFAVPAFEKHAADNICSLTKDYPQPTTYNAETDVYEQPEEEGSKTMVTVGKPAMYLTEDGEKVLYSFEDSGWTWGKDKI